MLRGTYKQCLAKTRRRPNIKLGEDRICKKQKRENIHIFFFIYINAVIILPPGVAGTVLQTPLSLVSKLTHPFPPSLHALTVRARDLKFS